MIQISGIKTDSRQLVKFTPNTIEINVNSVTPVFDWNFILPNIFKIAYLPLGKRKVVIVMGFGITVSDLYQGNINCGLLV